MPMFDRIERGEIETIVKRFIKKTTPPTLLSDLSDVSSSSPSTNDVLTWNGSIWIPAAGVGGSSNLNGLTDVTIAGVANDQILQYNSGTSQWENTALPAIPVSIDDLSDVDTTTIAPIVNDVLTWDGTNWSPLGAQAPKFIDDLSDVDTSTNAPNTDDILVWDGSNWIPSGTFHGTTDGQVLAECKNLSANTLFRGQPVYISGTVGSTTTLEVQEAVADNPATMPAVGLIYDTSLAPNAFGHVVILGALRQCDTGGFTVGQTVYVAPSTDTTAINGYTNIRPNAWQAKVQNIGRVGRVNASTGEIIVSGSGRTNDVMNDLHDAPSNVCIWSDFTSTIPFTIVTSGTNASTLTTVTGQNNDDHVGVARSSTGTTATGRSAITFSPIDTIQFGVGEVRFRAIVKIQTLNNGTDSFEVRVGFSDNTTVNSPTDAVHFVYNAGSLNWICSTLSAGVGLPATDSGVAVVANQWYRMEIIVNDDASEAYYYIDGVLVHTEISNIPTGSARRTGIISGIRKIAGTNVRYYYTDYLEVSKEVTR